MLAWGLEIEYKENVLALKYFPRPPLYKLRDLSGNFTPCFLSMHVYAEISSSDLAEAADPMVSCVQVCS